MAEAAIARADWAEACGALRAEGMAFRALREPRRAIASLDRAVRIARRSGDTALEILPLVTRAGTHLSLGNRRRAIADIGRAEERAVGQHVGPVLVQKAIIHLRLGQPVTSLHASNSAVQHLSRGDDPQSLGTALMNRGIVRTYLGETSRARSDLEAAVQLYEVAGDRVQAATARHNLGFASLHGGDIADALTRFDEASAELSEIGVDAVEVELDRADALLVAGMAPEAGELASAIAGRLRRRDLTVELGEALLLAARAEMVDGRHERARKLAAEARDVLRACGRRRWAAEADFLLVECRRATRSDPDDVREYAAAARRLDAAGLTLRADQAWLSAGLSALAHGDDRRGRTCLLRVARLRTAAPLQRRLLGWTAEAHLRAAGLSNASAARAISAGVRTLEMLTTTVAAHDLEAGIAGSAQSLLDLGQRLVVDAGESVRVFEWVERTRARGLRTATPPVVDDDVERALKRRRALVDVLGRAEDDLSQRALRQQVNELEVEIRRRLRRYAGSGGMGEAAGVERVASAASDGETFVALFEHRAELRSIAVDTSGTRGRVIGEMSQFVRARDRLLAEMRDAVNYPDRASESGALRAAAVQLDDLIRRGLGDITADALVIAPPPSLHDIPWRLLPSFAGMKTVVAPSASSWIAAGERRHTRSGRPVLVAGPGLRWAAEEVANAASVYTTALQLTGAAASVERVLEAASGASVVHLAAHGRFRADNALFSSIELADGPMTGYDVRRLELAPELVVLSNCESARSRAYPGGEMVGVSSELLRLGASCVIASVAPVDDRFVGSMMRDLHGSLRSDVGGATALLAATSNVWEGSPSEIATRGAFVAVGSD